MVQPPLVSVVIPAFNAEAFIAHTLDSVLAQTYQNFEVWVVDDGSCDQTAAIVEQFMQQDQRIRLLHQKNAGVAAARNLGIQHAQGDYIAPLDADDIWYPQKLEKQVRCLQEAGPEVGLVYAWSEAIDAGGKTLKEGYTASCFEGEVYTSLLAYNFVGNASVPLIRRTCLEEVGCYNAELRNQNAQGCEDWDLYLRVGDRYQFQVVPEFLVGYRQLAGSMSVNLAAMAKSYNLVMAQSRKQHPELSAAIYQQSRQFYYRYLAAKSHGNGNVWGAWYWQSQAMGVNVLHFLRFRLLRTWIKGLLRPLKPKYFVKQKKTA